MAVVLLGLAAYVYFTEIRGRAEREAAEKEAQLLVHFEPEEVSGIEVTGSEGTVAADRVDGSWHITAPRPVDADSAAFDRIVDDLHGARQERLIVESAEDLTAYGLQEPEVAVTLTLGDGRRIEVAIGKDTPIGFNLYAGVDGSSVYSAPRSLRASLDKKLLDLRDRSVISFERESVRRVEIFTTDYAADLRRQDDESADDELWAAVSPFSGRADAETIDSLLSSLNDAEAEAFVLESAPDAEASARFGFDSPRATVTLWTADDSSQKLIIGGESTEPAGRYAAREGGDTVFVVGGELVDDIPAAVDDLRNKQVLALARDRVRAIELTHGDVDARLERQGADWKLTRPRQLEADSSAVSGLLSTLQDMRAERFGSRLGAVELRARLALGTEDSPEEESIELQVGAATSVPAPSGEADAEPESVRPVIASGDDTVYLVADSDLEDLFADAFKLRAKTLVEFDNSDVQQLSLSDDSGTSWQVQRQEDEWKVEGNDTFDSSKAADLLWDLNYLRMEQVGMEWDGEQPDLSEFGLQAPRFRIVASGEEGSIAGVSIGSDVPQSDGSPRVWVRVDGSAGVFAVTGRLLDAVEALAEALRGSP